MWLTVIPIIVRSLGMIPKVLEESLEELELKRRIDIILTATLKSPRDLRRLAVTQTPLKDHQLTLVFKTYNNNNNDNTPDQTTRPCDTQQQKKRTGQIVYFGVPTDNRVKFKRDIYLDMVRELKKPWNMKMTVIPIVVRALGTIHKRMEDLEIKGDGRLGNQRTSRVYSDFNITKIDQNTEKSPRLEVPCYHSTSSNIWCENLCKV